ncbi:hypothetical protein Tco_1445548, partial [Tanacetum coccineum]
TLLTICEGGAKGSELSDGDVLLITYLQKNRLIDDTPLDKRRKLGTGRIMASTTSSQGTQALTPVTTNQKEVTAASSEPQVEDETI